MKTYRIVNRKRFRIFQIMMIILLTATIVFLSFFILTKLSLGEKVNETDSIRVVEGDTLWDIANKISEYSNKKLDVREIVYEIKTLNNINGSDIYPGDVLIIPDI